MVNASSCTAELWMHSGDSGLLKGHNNSRNYRNHAEFIDVISVLNRNTKHARAIEFDKRLLSGR